MSEQTHSLMTPSRIALAVQSRFNPVKTCDPITLVSALDRWRLGYLREAALIFDVLEERDDTIRNVASKRKKAPGRHGWEIVKVEESPQADKHAEVLEEFWNNISATSALDSNERGGARLLARQMMDAVGKRYSVHEMVWSVKDTLTCEFRHAPLWFFEANTGKLRFLQNDYDYAGVEMDPKQWLVTVGDGLMLATSVTWMFKRLPLSDWLTFSEKFGYPVVHGEVDAEPDDAAWSALESAVQDFNKGLALVTKKGTATINIVGRGQSGDIPFPEMIDRADRAIASLWRGGDLGTMSRDGSAVGSNPQLSETALIEQDDRELLSETLNLQVEPIVIAWHFGEGVKPLAYIRFSGLNQQNTDLDLRVDEMLVKLGVPLSQQDAAERYNRALAEEGEPTLRAAAPPAIGNPMMARPGQQAEEEDDEEGDPLENEAARKGFEDDAKRRMLSAVALDLQPFRERLAAILEIQDRGILNSRLRSFKAELATLADDVKKDPESAKALEEIMSAAMINAMEEAS